jgi:hypothetical protein
LFYQKGEVNSPFLFVYLKIFTYICIQINKQMNNAQLTRLKEVLSVPTKTYKEDGMIEFICETLDNIDEVSYYTDKMNNVYVTKGHLPEGQ